jgi:phosphoesterase RecJ-like protein
MKSTPKIVDRILAGIGNSKTLCVVGHIRPDGDCIGSQLGLTLALQRAGKSVVCWNQDPVPQKYAFLDPGRQVKTPEPDQHFDCVIATDCASYERLGAVAECIQNRNLLINIDHHQSNTSYGDLNWIAAREPSTGELIFSLLRHGQWPITPAIANCLFTAISTDTGSFQYATTRPATFQIAGELVKQGADLARICDEVYQSFPLSRVRLVQHVYSHFKLTDQNRIAYLWLKRSDYQRTGADLSESEGLIDHIRAIEPVVIACVFEELEPNLVRISLRSKDARIDVNQIADQFGGGGHKAAAGARISGSPLSVQRRVLGSIKKALKAVLASR